MQIVWPNGLLILNKHNLKNNAPFLQDTSNSIGLTIHLYFTILVEVFMNHILTENTFHTMYGVNRARFYDL